MLLITFLKARTGRTGRVGDLNFRQSENALLRPRETVSLPSLYANSEVLEAVPTGGARSYRLDSAGANGARVRPAGCRSHR
jgi:hypothetical protein